MIEKIISKKEFSQLPRKDVELAFGKFDKKHIADFQKIKLTRNLLRRVYSSFTSRKLLNEAVNEKRDVNWILMKHKSTKERLEYYDEIYFKIFEGLEKVNVFDLGCGVNGLTYKFMKGKVRSYVGVEAVGQLVDLMNGFFKKNKTKNFKAVHLSLFELEAIKEILKKLDKPRVVLLFKVIDSLEDLERNYSKKLLLEISEILTGEDRIVLSFATKSLGKRQRFHAKRNWILKFIEENFNVKDDFEIGGERYLVLVRIS